MLDLKTNTLWRISASSLNQDGQKVLLYQSWLGIMVIGVIQGGLKLLICRLGDRFWLRSDLTGFKMVQEQMWKHLWLTGPQWSILSSTLGDSRGFWHHTLKHTHVQQKFIVLNWQTLTLFPLIHHEYSQVLQAECPSPESLCGGYWIIKFSRDTGRDRRVR